jgi:hypothetical protein
MARARRENTLIREGAGRSLINKTSPLCGAVQDLRNKTAGSWDENTLVSGGAGRSLINKAPRPRKEKSRE